MMRTIVAHPLSRAAFSMFGDVLEVNGAPAKLINQGLCGRHHDKAQMDFSDGRAGISIFDAQARDMPYALDMMERHPQGSQAFLPMHQHPFLVVVAADKNGTPDRPIAFLAAPGQGVNYHRNIWHGVLTPLYQPGLFAVVDRIGDGDNLEEHWFETPWQVELDQ